MAIDEQVRHDLFAGLQAVVGVEPAKLMMSAIPPFSWNEIATRADIAQLATREEINTEFAAVRLEFAAVRLEMANLDNQMHRHMTKSLQNLLFQIATINISTAGILIAALHFLR
ncbi:MAG: hypothetical protein ACYC06_01590 [Ilumatobacteraceae bacterium]